MTFLVMNTISIILSTTPLILLGCLIPFLLELIIDLSLPNSHHLVYYYYYYFYF